MKAIRFAGRGVHHVLRRGANRLRLTGHLVATHHVAVLRLGINDARVTQIGNGHEAVAAKNLEPVIIEDAAVHARRTRPTPVVVILHAATHVVRRLHVEAHMVEQADRHIGKERPRAAHIVRRGETTVTADDHVIRVLRIDPDAMHVVVRHQGHIGFEGAAAIERQVQANATHVNAIGIHRIDAQLAEIHRACIRVALLGPRRAAIVRLVQSGHARDNAARGRRRRCRVHVFRGRSSALR